MPAAPLGVVAADPKVRKVHVSPLWSTTAVSTAAVEHLSYGAPQLWSISAMEQLSCGAPQLAALQPWSTKAWNTPLRSTTTWSTATVEHHSQQHQCKRHSYQFSWILQISCSTNAWYENIYINIELNYIKDKSNKYSNSAIANYLTTFYSYLCSWGKFMSILSE